jgi:hypothetical protein
VRAGFLESPGAHQVAANPNVAAILVTRFPTALHLLRTDAVWPARSAELPPLDEFARRDRGAAVVDGRTSFVRRHATRSGEVYVKVYEYDTWASRLRGGARRTAPWATPRPVREFDALQWLRQHGFHAPVPLLAAAQRCLGFVARAVLVTAAWPGQPASAVLPTLEATERRALANAIRRLLRELHNLGFRDRNFDLRNLLVQRTPTGWHIAKIDSPRHRLVRPGTTGDRLATADWRRLEPQLAACAPAP